MNFLVLLLLVNAPLKTITIFDFNSKSNINSWQIVNDVVMGGKSSSTITINKEGHGQFSGTVSTENNGGFSSVRHIFKSVSVKKTSKICALIKGDGKVYQLRVKDRYNNYYSYIHTFSTSKNWQEIEIPLSEMYPSFRGKNLNKSNFNHDAIEEITFLIANNKSEKFQLIIDKIYLK